MGKVLNICRPRVKRVQLHEHICLISFCLCFWLKYTNLLLKVTLTFPKVIFWQDAFTSIQFIVFTATFWVFSQHWLSDPKRKTHHYSIMMLSCCERCHSSVSSRLVFVSVRSLRPPDPVDSYTRTVLIKSFCLSLPDCNWWQWLHCLLGWTLWLVDLLYCHAPVLFCSPSARAHEHSTDRKNSKLHTGLGIFFFLFYFFF